MSGSLRLLSSSLLSKWGFNDGDIPEWVSEAAVAAGVEQEVDWDAVLTRLVREHLLPALDQVVVVEVIATMHNPVRARTVDGTDVTDAWCDPHTQVRLTPDAVEVPMDVVVALCRQHTFDGPNRSDD